jgi:hypothetical protein
VKGAFCLVYRFAGRLPPKKVEEISRDSIYIKHFPIVNNLKEMAINCLRWLIYKGSRVLQNILVIRRVEGFLLKNRLSAKKVDAIIVFMANVTFITLL